MRRLNRVGFALGIVSSAVMATGSQLVAQSVTTNPFRPLYGWGELPDGREWGSSSTVEIALDGNIWVAERCGSNSCVGSGGRTRCCFTTGKATSSAASAPG